MQPMPNDFEPAERGLRDHLAVGQRRIVVLVLVTVVCGVAALATSLLQPQRFQASAQVLVPVEPAGQPGQDDTQTRFDPNRVIQTEAAFAVGEQVRSLAETKVGTDGAVTARGAKDSDIITITATAGAADRAAAVANAYASSYVELRQPPDGIKGVLVIEAASPPGGPSSPATARNVVLGLLFGLALGIAAAYALDQLDDVIRNEDDLARLVLLPVVGSVGAGTVGAGTVSTTAGAAPPADGPRSGVVRVLDATDASLAGTDASMLEGAPGAKVLVVAVGARGRTARHTAAILRSVGLPVAGAVLLDDERVAAPPSDP
jgi:capsular polysaccharide biosynthesis protein